MTRRSPFAARTILCISAAIALAVFSAPARAQTATNEDADSHLDQSPINPDEKVRLQELHDGSKPLGADDKALLDKAARFYVYRVTHKKFQERVPDVVGSPAGKSVYDILQTELYPLIFFQNGQANLKPDQEKFQTELMKALLPPIEKVLQNPTPIARINGAIILGRLCQLGQDDPLNLLVTALEDPNQLIAVKFHVLAGLRTLFNFKNGPNGGIFQDRDLERHAIQAIIDFLNRKMPEPKDGVAPEDLDAFRYVRREAIRALGQTKYPAIAVKKVVVARPALELLKVLRRDGVIPESSESEQVEAAIALCQLKSIEYTQYQPEYAAYNIGFFLLEFGDRYAQNRGQGTSSGSWKYDSTRLIDALQTLRADAGTRGKVNDLINLATGILKNIQSGSQVSDLPKLRTWLSQNPPPKNMTYENEPSSTVKGSEGS